MKRINSPRNAPLAAAALLAVLLLASGAAAKPKLGRENKVWEQLFFNAGEYDLNDEFNLSPVLRSRSKSAHLQDPEAVPSTTVQADGTVQNVSVVKNEDLLPTNLFVTPDITLEEAHPKTESEGYLQVLQAMKYTPVVEEAKPASSKVIVAKPGLNGALLKILTATKQITGAGKAAATSESWTINRVIQSLSALAFTNTYNEFNNTALANSTSKIIYVNAPAQNKTILNFANGTKVFLEGDVSTNDQGQVLANDQAAAEAQAQIAAQNQIPSRLLTLMRMYAEHVENKDKDIIADEAHYGHLKSMDRHLVCLTDNSCDFSRHLLGLVSGPAPRSRHLLETYLANNQEFKPNHLVQFESQIASLIKALPGFTSNEAIKEASGNFIAQNKDKLDQFLANWPQTNDMIQNGIATAKQTLPTFQNLSPDQFLAMLNQINQSQRQKIDEEFTANGLSKKVEDLTNELNAISGLHAALRGVLPAQGVLNSDFESLEKRLQNHIQIFQQAQQATPEQLQAARTKLKNNLQMQLNGLDPVANSELIRSIANDSDAILKSDFGKSLNKENLDFIVHKAIKSLKVDFDQMKNANKPSGFMLDQADLQRVADDVVDELKKSREANQKAVINLKDFHKAIQQENRKYSAEPASGDSASDAADLLISYESFYYDLLSSDEFYGDLTNYIGNYYEVYYSHAAPLQPFFSYSDTYKTLTAGLNNPNALGVLNAPAVRLLLKSGEQQVAHLSALSESDKRFFHLLDSLVAEWAQTQDPVSFNRKLGGIIDAVQGKSNGLVSAHLLTFSEEHKAFALFDTVKNAILDVIRNLGSSATAANGLANTIGNGQQLVKSAAEQYQVVDLLTNNSTSTGFIGGIKNKVKGWLGFRALEVHYGLTDTISSVQNLWKSMTQAKDTADKLKGTIHEAQGFANNVQEGINVFNSIVGANA